MGNPLHALPMFHPAVPQGTFNRAFVKGASSGALMMGIFSSLLFVGSLIPPLGITFSLGYSLTMLGLGSVATGLFSGVMASHRSVEQFNAANTQSRPAASREPVRAPEHNIAPTQAQGQWTDRVGRSGGQDRISQIIADRGMNDADRATAILRERELAAGTEAIR